MIRVGTDKRRIHSAELLLEGLVFCMEKKDFTQISISDLQKASGVSRATFYRLFDNVQDVLDYKCRAMAAELPARYRAAAVEQRESFLLFTLQYWMEQHRFLDAIFASGRTDILQNALLENDGLVQELFSGIVPEGTAMEYIASASMGILSSILITWVRHEKRETPEQLVEIFQRFFQTAPALFHTP